MTMRPPATARLAWAALALLLGTAGCNPLYVARAGYEEARILWRRRPIAEMLEREPLSAETRAKLQLVLRARAFAAARLGLRVGGSYATFSRVGPEQTVWVVSAAPRNRLELHTWWFPIVGRVPYRGYFSERRARTFAADLEQRGFDTYVRPAVAFSTLGWFDDPLLSSTLDNDPVTLASVVIHELLHNTVYLPGAAAFNESFATFAGWRGAIALFRAEGRAGLAREAADVWADELSFGRHLELLVARLRRLYREPFDEARRRSILRDWAEETAGAAWRTDRYRHIDRVPLNNAVILHYRLYACRLDLFERAYLAHNRDLRATLDWIRGLVRGSERDPFEILSAALAPRDGQPATWSAAGRGTGAGRRAALRNRCPPRPRRASSPAAGTPPRSGSPCR